MKPDQFDQLVKGVTEIRAHLRGAKVRGAITTTVDRVDTPQVKQIREAVKISQSEFVQLIGVSVRTMQNWEQQRTVPNGPTRALLRIVANNPQALKALQA